MNTTKDSVLTAPPTKKLTNPTTQPSQDNDIVIFNRLIKEKKYEVAAAMIEAGKIKCLSANNYQEIEQKFKNDLAAYKILQKSHDEKKEDIRILLIDMKKVLALTKPFAAIFKKEDGKEEEKPQDDKKQKFPVKKVMSALNMVRNNWSSLQNNWQSMNFDKSVALLKKYGVIKEEEQPSIAEKTTK